MLFLKTDAGLVAMNQIKEILNADPDGDRLRYKAFTTDGDGYSFSVTCDITENIVDLSTPSTQLVKKIDEDKAYPYVFRTEHKQVKEFKIGDSFSIEIDRSEYTATIIDEDEYTMLCLLDDCLKKQYAINLNGGTGSGYKGSDLRESLNKLDHLLPGGITEAFNDDGDFLFLLNITQVAGLNNRYEEVDGQIEWLKNRRHRIALRDDKSESWWLSDPVSTIGFAHINQHGHVFSAFSSDRLGVRPAFKIMKL